MGVQCDHMVGQDLRKMLQECTYCHKLIVPWEALQAPCGHIFCFSCTPRLVAGFMPLCPKDNMPVIFEELRTIKIENLNIDRDFFDSITVKCAQCTWQGANSDIAEHENTCSGVTHCKCCKDSRKRCVKLQEDIQRLKSKAAVVHEHEQLQERTHSQDAQLAIEKKRIVELERQIASQGQEALRAKEQLQQLADDLEQSKAQALELERMNAKLESDIQEYQETIRSLLEEVSVPKNERLPLAPMSREEGGPSGVNQDSSNTPPRRRPSPVSTPTTGACFCDLTGHTSRVTALTVSESNIFSGAADRTIKMWNMDTGRCVGTIPGGTRSPFRPRSETGHTDHVTALCCGPNRMLYSASTDKTIKAWKGGKWLATLKGHDGSVLALTVTSDNVLFSGGKDKVIRRWDNMRPGGDLRGHAEPVTALAIAPNGRLWSGDAGSNVKGWQDGEPFNEFPTHQGSISGLAFDGNDTLWTASSDNVTVRGWKGNRCVALLDAHMDVVTALAVAPDGTVWTGSRDETVQGHRWDGVAPPMCVVIYKGHKGGVTALAVGHDGTVWSGGRDKLIMGWRPLGQGVPPSSGAP